MTGTPRRRAASTIAGSRSGLTTNCAPASHAASSAATVRIVPAPSTQASARAVGERRATRDEVGRRGRRVERHLEDPRAGVGERQDELDETLGRRDAAEDDDQPLPPDRGGDLGAPAGARSCYRDRSSTDPNDAGGSSRAAAQPCGGAVLSRTISSVASSTRGWAGASPRAIASTSSAAASAISIERLADRSSAAARPTARPAGRRSRRRSGPPGCAAAPRARPGRRPAPGGRCRRRSPSAGPAKPEQRPAAVDPLLDVELAVADELRVDRHAGLVHRRAVAVDPGAAAQDPVRPADDADPAVAEAQQVARRGQAAVPVRRPDRRRVVERLAGRVDDRRTGCPASASWARIVSLRSENTAMTPVGRRASDALDPAAARVAAGPASRTGRPRAGAGPATRSTPRTISSAHSLSSSWKITSSSGARRAVLGRPLVAVLAGSPPRPRRRVSADTSARPLIDLRHGRHRDARPAPRCPRWSS